MYACMNFNVYVYMYSCILLCRFEGILLIIRIYACVNLCMRAYVRVCIYENMYV